MRPRSAGRPLTRVERVEVAAYRIPTDSPESDGTLEWDSTTMVLVQVESAGVKGMGYTYAGESAGALIREKLAHVVRGADCLSPRNAWNAMARSVRNLGRDGIASTAISAVDIALWDLKSKLLELPLAQLLGQVRQTVPVYGSGGFTSYSLAQLQEQLGDWAAQGFRSVKMKIGREPSRDLDRVRVARQAIGPAAQLFVDANGAYGLRQACAQASRFAELGVTWFEEPVSSDDLDGLRFVRERSPPDMDITAGEYGYDLFYFRRMLQAEAVDVIQPDATRCGGVTGFMQAVNLAEAFSIPVSAHTAPSLHLHMGCANARVRHLEYFHDHARIEHMLFDGAPEPLEGNLSPDWARPGLGLEFKAADAEPYRVG